MKYELKQENYTFFSANYISQDEISNAHNCIAIFGAPFDVGSLRPGSRFGPAVIRELSCFCFSNNKESKLVNNSNFKKTWNYNRLLDLGDLFLEQNSTQNAINGVYSLVSDLPKNSVPLMIGGDHSLTYGSILSLYQKYNDNFLLIHFDQHLDIDFCNIDQNINKIKHCNFISHIIKDCPNLKILQIGQRWLSSISVENDLSKYDKLSIITNLDIATHSFEQINTFLPSKCNIYISFDVDVLSKHIIKNTAYPSSFGVTLEKFLPIFLYLCENNQIIGADIMEFGSHNIDEFSDETLVICNILALLITKVSSYMHNDEI